MSTRKRISAPKANDIARPNTRQRASGMTVDMMQTDLSLL
jgi:hypothetical protein